MAVTPIPDQTSSVIPYLVVADAAQLIDFLKQAFDAQEMHRTSMPNGVVMHAHLRIRGSSIMLGQAPPGHELIPAMLYTYVEDADSAYAKAIAAGAKTLHELKDQFYGDRAGAVKDPAGNQWWIASHKEEVSGEELARRAKAARSEK